jgi:hypothetical protein
MPSNDKKEPSTVVFNILGCKRRDLRVFERTSVTYELAVVDGLIKRVSKKLDALEEDCSLLDREDRADVQRQVDEFFSTDVSPFQKLVRFCTYR